MYILINKAFATIYCIISLFISTANFCMQTDNLGILSDECETAVKHELSIIAKQPIISSFMSHKTEYDRRIEIIKNSLRLIFILNKYKEKNNNILSDKGHNAFAMTINDQNAVVEFVTKASIGIDDQVLDNIDKRVKSFHKRTTTFLNFMVQRNPVKSLKDLSIEYIEQNFSNEQLKNINAHMQSYDFPILKFQASPYGLSYQKFFKKEKLENRDVLNNEKLVSPDDQKKAEARLFNWLFRNTNSNYSQRNIATKEYGELD